MWTHSRGQDQNASNPKAPPMQLGAICRPRASRPSEAEPPGRTTYAYLPPFRHRSPGNLWGLRPRTIARARACSVDKTPLHPWIGHREAPRRLEAFGGTVRYHRIKHDRVALDGVVEPNVLGELLRDRECVVIDDFIGAVVNRVAVPVKGSELAIWSEE